MTVLDLLKLIKHHWKIAVIVPVVCALACVLALVIMPAQYRAQVQINLSGEPGSIGSIASGTVAAADLQGTKASAKTDTTAKTVTITVNGSSADTCIAVVNELAKTTVDEAKQMYENVTASYKPAETAANVSPSIAKYGLAALMLGLFLALCIIVLLDTLRAPIKDAASLQALTDLPMLATLPALDGGERMLANVRFASGKDDLKRICIVPAGINSTAAAACVTLAKAIEAEGGTAKVVDVGHGSTVVGSTGGAGSIEIQSCQNLAAGMSGMYAAKAADAVVVAVRQWNDSLRDLEDTLQELSLAQANVAGLVLVQ